MNKRSTIQRTLVFDAVKQLHNHASADEVYEYIEKKHPTISRGTVYRNLNTLADSGEILRIEVPNGADRYDHRSCNHYHIKCIKCKNVSDVDMDYITDLEKNIRDTHGFEFQRHDIVFKGICLGCNKKM